MLGGLSFQVFATTLFFLFCADYALRTRKWQKIERSHDFQNPTDEHKADYPDRQAIIPTGNGNGKISRFFNDIPTGAAPEKFARIRNSRMTYVYICGIMLSVIFVYIRSVYRIAELSQGWNGYLMETEGYFLILDGLMVAIAIVLSCIFYPAIVLGRMKVTQEYKEAVRMAESDRAKEEETLPNLYQQKEEDMA